MPVLHMKERLGILMLPVKGTVQCGTPGTTLHHVPTYLIQGMQERDGSTCHASGAAELSARGSAYGNVNPDTTTGHQARHRSSRKPSPLLSGVLFELE